MDTGYKTLTNLVSTGNFEDCTVSRLNTSDSQRARLNWNNSSSAFVANNFSLGVPDDAVIEGIEVLIQRRSTRTDGNVRVDARLSWNNGSSYTSYINGSSYNLTSDANQIIGGSTELWGRSWTSDELKNANFRLGVRGVSGFPTVLEINYIAVKVYYSTSGGKVYIKQSGVFGEKPILIKSGGTFVEKPVNIKVGGTFQESS